MSLQTASQDSSNVTSSEELPDGLSPFEWLDSVMISTPGPAAAPASRSRSRASKKVRATIATSGPSGSSSFGSADLNTFLASRLQTLLGMDGLMEFLQTWKQKTTPAGRLYWEHTARNRRTSDSDCGSVQGWPTPMNGDTTGGKVPPSHESRNTPSKLKQVAQLTDWPTTTVNDSRGGRNRTASRTNDQSQHHDGLTLVDAAELAGWNTPRATDGSNGGPNQAGGALPADAAMAGWVSPSSRDWKDTPGMSDTGVNPDGTLRNRTDQLPRQVYGLIIESSPASTASRGVLEPAMSRWLMGYSTEWDQVSPQWEEWMIVQSILMEI